MDNEIDKLLNEDVNFRDGCNLCRESVKGIGHNTGYGAIVYKIGNKDNGWFATLSPKTGGNPKFDFTLQLMPQAHLTHFSQIGSYPELARNFGISFSKLCRAMTVILMKEEDLMAEPERKERSVPIASYGKCTTWKEKKEHLHIKIFQFRDNIGQSYTVDSSFERKEVFKERDSGKEFVKMTPVRKVTIGEKRFNKLSRDLINLLK